MALFSLFAPPAHQGPARCLAYQQPVILPLKHDTASMQLMPGVSFAHSACRTQAQRFIGALHVQESYPLRSLCAMAATDWSVPNFDQHHTLAVLDIVK